MNTGRRISHHELKMDQKKKEQNNKIVTDMDYYLRDKKTEREQGSRNILVLNDSSTAKKPVKVETPIIPPVKDLEVVVDVEDVATPITPAKKPATPKAK